MAQLKYCDKHNQVGFLLKPTESAGYTEIVDFLRRSKLRYALTHNPPIYDSLVKQFWQTATARTLADGTQQLNATIDSIEYTITEESVRRQLQLADASGINMLQNEEIFEGLQNIGSKSGGWDQFGSNIATALICLSTGRDFNFSKLIFDGMISNLKSKSKFLMYPRFLQMILNVQTENKNLFVPVLLTKKIFGNMKRSFQGIHRPLLPAMLTIDAGQPQPSAAPTPSQPVPTPSPSHVQITPPSLSQPPPTLTQPVQSTSPPPQPSSVQPTSSPPPIQPVQPTSSPPITTIPDTQPTLPPSPQIPSPSYHDTEGPSFEPSYHMSPPPSHEPEIQTSRPSEESEQLRNLLDLVPRLESRVESLEKELSDTKQTLGTAILQLIEKVKKLENKLRQKRKSEETEDAEGQDQEVPSQTDQGNAFATPEKSKDSGEAQADQISPSTLEAAQILTNVASEGFRFRGGFTRRTYKSSPLRLHKSYLSSKLILLRVNMVKTERVKGRKGNGAQRWNEALQAEVLSLQRNLKERQELRRFREIQEEDRFCGNIGLKKMKEHFKKMTMRISLLIKRIEKKDDSVHEEVKRNDVEIAPDESWEYKDRLPDGFRQDALGRSDDYVYSKVDTADRLGYNSIDWNLISWENYTVPHWESNYQASYRQSLSQHHSGLSSLRLWTFGLLPIEALYHKPAMSLVVTNDFSRVSWKSTADTVPAGVVSPDTSIPASSSNRLLVVLAVPSSLYSLCVHKFSTTVDVEIPASQGRVAYCSSLYHRLLGILLSPSSDIGGTLKKSIWRDVSCWLCSDANRGHNSTDYLPLFCLLVFYPHLNQLCCKIHDPALGRCYAREMPYRIWIRKNKRDARGIDVRINSKVGGSWSYRLKRRALDLMRVHALYLTALKAQIIMFVVSACSRTRSLPLTSNLNASNENPQLVDGQFLGRRLISGSGKKQTVVGTYATEAEYVTCCSLLVWLTTGFLWTEQFLLVVFLVSAGRVVPAGHDSIPDPHVADDPLGGISPDSPAAHLKLAKAAAIALTLLLCSMGSCCSTWSASDFSADPSHKGKSPMVEEDPPMKERSFSQMEEDRLGAEAARKLYEEEQAELARVQEEMKKKRQEDVINSASITQMADWSGHHGTSGHAYQGLTD
ncbi:hypothetical protein Tco_1375894 [Tanacetum coccineum]